MSYTLTVLPVVSMRSTAAEYICVLQTLFIMCDTHEVTVLAAVNIRSTAAENNWRCQCGTHKVTVFAVVKMTYLEL